MVEVECNIATCPVGKPLADMIRVEDLIDGQPIVGQACSLEHARQLHLQWTTGDRWSEPDPMWSTVGNGLVAA